MIMSHRTWSQTEGSTAEIPNFSCVTFDSYESFFDYRQKAEKTLGVRWLYERTLASRQSEISHDGTCGVCWRPCTFRSSTRSGEVAPGGRLPSWREEQICDCNYSLISRERAALHYVTAACRLDRTTRLLALSTSRAFGHAVKFFTQTQAELSSSQTLQEHDASSLAKVYGSYHTVVSAEEFSFVDYDGLRVKRIRSVLCPGGSLVFTCPFDINSSPEDQVVENVIGWSFFAVLREAGFRVVRAHLYWSEEQGYLGPFNLLFTALT